MSDRERVTQFTGEGGRGEASLASEDQRCDCCDIPLMSPVMCGPGWVRPVSLQSIIMDIMTSRLIDQYKATKRLDSYLLSQFKS